MVEKLFPTILIILDVASAIVFMTPGHLNGRKIVYWLAAAALTAAVTY